MNYITINNLIKSYNSTVILSGLNFSLNSGEKMAVVGRNGAGKTTLANIICGAESYDSGEVYIAGAIKIGYFTQESFVDSDDTVIEEMNKVFTRQYQLKTELERFALELKEDSNAEKLDRYTKMLHTFEEIGGYTYEYQVETILNKFGFKEYYGHPVNNLSGGQRTRLALAKLLLENPDVLILDEPTNHLDIETIEFLESYLKSFKNSLMIISHDRYFLNQVANTVYEIEFGKGTLYKGNYDAFLRQKTANYAQMIKQFEIQQKMIQKEQEFIDKNIVRATTSTRAKSRRKKLEKIEVMENPKTDNKNITVDFDFKVNTGNIVLEAEHLSIGYDKPLKTDINFTVKKGEKVAIIGPNGIGKSTLLKTINEAEEPLDGDIYYGSNLQIAYFDQDLAMLNSHKTVIDELWDEHRMMLEKDVRTLLGSFLFIGDDVFKTVSDLSGGEKVRLALAKLVLKKANFLILDEVTNHLDILSREVLEDALSDFAGTILFVTHDRFFIDKLATRIIEIRAQDIIDYPGGYGYYLDKKAQFDVREVSKTGKTNQDFLEQKKQKSDARKTQKQIEQLESEIAFLEAEITDLKARQYSEEVYSDYEKARTVKEALEEKSKALEEKITAWTVLADE